MQRHSVVVPADVRAGMIFPWTRKRVLILFCVVFFFFFFSPLPNQSHDV